MADPFAEAADRLSERQAAAGQRAAGLDLQPEAAPEPSGLRLAPAPSLAPPEPAAAPPDEFAAAADRLSQRQIADAETQRQLTASIAQHTEWTPAQRQDIALYSVASGRAPEDVAANFDAVKGEVNNESLRNALATRPWVADLIAHSPTAAATLKDDMANAGWLEWGVTGRFDRVDTTGIDPATGKPATDWRYTGPAWARAARDAFTHGQRYVYLSAKQAGGQTSEEENKELDQLEKDEEKDYVGDAAPGLLGTLRHQAAQSVVGLAKTIPYLAGRELAGAAGSVAGGAVGGALTGGAAVETGPGEVVAVPAGAITGGRVGYIAATAAYDFYQTIGPTYRMLRGLRGSDGERLLDDDTARAYAVGATIPMTALMQLPGGKIGEKAREMIAVGPLKNLLGKAARDGAAEIVEQAAVRTATGEFKANSARLALEGLKSFGKAELYGGMLMGAQSGMSEAARQVALGTHGEEWSAKAVGGAYAHGFIQGARDFAILSAAAPVRAFFRERGVQAQSVALANRMTILTDAAKDSAYLATHPQEARAQIAASAQEHGAVTEAFIHRDALDSLAKARGTDGRALLSKISENGGRAYDEAAASGNDFVRVPIGDYLVGLAGTKELLHLAPDVKLSQEGRTEREILEHVRLEGEAEKLAAGAGKEHDALEQVRQEAHQRWLDVGRSETEAASNAEIISRSMATFAKEEGKGRSALDVWAESPLRTFNGLTDKASGETSLAQHPLDVIVPTAPGADGRWDFTSPGSDIRLQVEKGDGVWTLKNLDFSGLPTTKEAIAARRGKGDSSILYARVLAEAAKAGVEVHSDDTRTPATIDMYSRLADAGLKFTRAETTFRSKDGEIGGNHVISLEQLRAFDALGNGWDDMLERNFRSALATAEVDRLNLPPAEAAKIRREEVVLGTLPDGETGLLTITKLDQPGNRGQLRFRLPNGKPREFKLEFLAADESTGVHEVTHYLGEVLHDLATAEGAGPEIRARYDALLKYQGFTTPEERVAATVERTALGAKMEGGKATPEEAARFKALSAKEERFSHAMEAYLAEGKAPSAELAGVFRWFKLAMIKIYRGVDGIRAQFKAKYGEELAVSPEMKLFFDRLLTVDDTTQRTEAEVERPERFAAALKDATPEEVVQLNDLRERERDGHERELLRRIVEDEKRETTRWFQGERRKITDEVEANLSADPAYKALRYLWHGILPGVDVLPKEMQKTLPEAARLPESLRGAGGRALKLDRSTVVERYGRPFADRLPREWFAREGGVDPDVLAEHVHFASGDEMLRAVADATRPAKLVENEVQRRMEERYGKPLLTDQEALGREALDAMHDEAGAKRVLLEMRILARKLDPSVPARMRGISLEAIRDTAERLIQSKLVGEIRPSYYLAGERGAAEKALRLAAEGKTAQAYDQKELQLLNRYLWRAAKEAREVAAKDATALQEFTTQGRRAELGKAFVTNADGTISQPYLEKVDGLLEHFEFRKSVSGREMLSRQGLLAWIEAQKADNRDVVIPDRVLAKLERSISWKELTPPDLAALRDAVDSIANQADLKVYLRAEGEKRAFTDVQAELDAGARTNLGEQKFYEKGEVMPLAEKVRREAVKIGHAVLRPEELIRRLDGGRIDGPWSRYIWKPVNDATYAWLGMVRDVVKPIREALEKLPAADKKRLATDRFTPETLPGEVYPHEAVVAVIANQGNASNARHFLEGRSAERMTPWGKGAWTRATVEEFLSRSTRGDWDLAQRMWDACESVWPKIADLEKRLHGLAPEKVEAKPITRWFDASGRSVPEGTAGAEAVTYRGGYYPIVPEPAMSHAGGAREEEASTLKGVALFDANYARAATAQGHLIERNDRAANPITLSLDALPHHINQMTKDLAMREALIGANRLLTSTDVRRSLRLTVGEDGEKLLHGWLRDAANEMVIPDRGEGAGMKIITGAQSGMTGAVFAFNVAQAMQNLGNVGNVMSRVPSKFLLPAFARFARDRGKLAAWATGDAWFDAKGMLVPEGTPGATKGPVSGDLRHRLYTADPDIGREMRAAVGRGGALGTVKHKIQRVKETGMIFMRTVDAMVAYPSFLAAYEHASAPVEKGGLGLSDRNAFDHADRILRLSLSAGATKDLPALMRSPKAKFLTMFYGFANTQLNLLNGLAFDSRQGWREGGAKEKAAAVANIIKGYAFIAGSYAIGDALTGKGPQDEDQSGEVDSWDALRWYAHKVAVAPLMWIPVLSSIVRAKEEHRKGVSLSPWTRVFEAAGDAASSTYDLAAQALTGEDVSSDSYIDAGSKTLQALGYAAGLPVSQAQATGKYAYGRLVDGTDEGASAAETAWGLAYGPKKPGRISELLFGEE